MNGMNDRLLMLDVLLMASHEWSESHEIFNQNDSFRLSLSASDEFLYKLYITTASLINFLE
jgi:hypothetical protein